MRKTIFAIGALCALAFCVATARAQSQSQPANVAGSWDLTITTPRGDRTSTLKLDQDGGKIKGTVSGRMGDRPVEGTVDGNNIKFSMKFQGRDGNERTIDYSGTVSGDSMKGTVQFGPNSVDWTAKRSQSQGSQPPAQQ